MVNILISGLTAAGKTTHALLLSENLGYEYISATQLMASIVGIPRNQVDQRFWIEHGDRIEHLRRTTDLDLELDRQLADLCSSREDLVVDAWAAPWLIAPSNGIRVWLSSSLATRTLKASVSDFGARPHDWYRDFIHAKDVNAQQHFARLYDFDLFATDSAAFDVIIDNSSYIFEATRPAADAGIQGFHPVFRDQIKATITHKSSKR